MKAAAIINCDGNAYASHKRGNPMDVYDLQREMPDANQTPCLYAKGRRRRQSRRKAQRGLLRASDSCCYAQRATTRCCAAPVRTPSYRFSLCLTALHIPRVHHVGGTGLQGRKRAVQRTATPLSARGDRRHEIGKLEHNRMAVGKGDWFSWFHKDILHVCTVGA